MTIIKLSNDHGKLLCDDPECNNLEIVSLEEDTWIYPEYWMELFFYNILKNLCPKCSDLLFHRLNGNKLLKKIS